MIHLVISNYMKLNKTSSQTHRRIPQAKAKDPNVNKLPKTKMTVPMATMCVWFVRFLSSLPSVSLLCCTDWDASSEALSAASDILLIEGIDLSFWFSISLAASLP